MDNSFDIVSQIDFQEVDNAVNNAMKEISQRYDFKGSKSKIEFQKTEKQITILADDDFKLKSVKDILESKIVKRKIEIKALQYGSVEKAFEGTVRQIAKIQQGIPQEKVKEIVKFIKDSKIKVQPTIQGDQIRVSSKSKDLLQEVIGLIQQKNFDIPLQFINYR